MSTYPNIYAQKFGDCYTLSAFTNGVGNAHDSDLGSQLAVGAILGGIPLAKATVWDGPKWLINNYGHYGETWKGMKDANNTQKATAKAFKDALKGGENSAYNWFMKDARLQEFQGAKSKSVQPKYDTKLVRQLTKDSKTEEIASYKEAFKMQKKQSDCYKEARLILNRIKKQGLKGDQLRTALKELEGAINKGDLKVLEGIKAGTIKPVGKWSKAWNFVKAKSSYNKLNRGLLKGMTHGIDDSGKVIEGVVDKFGSKALRTVAKGAKGGGLLTAGIEMAFETPEIIETYSKLGVAKGTKQLGKSAATATASAVGWVVGAKIGAIAGAKAGAAIGAAIGSVAPGVGNVVGGVIGSIIGIGCGIAGSWLCHKGMKSLMGKSELEKANDENTLAMAKKASESDEGKKELLEAAKATADAQGGVSDQNVIDAYSRLLNEREGETVDYTQAKDGKSALVQQLEQQYQTENNSQVTNKKSALLYQLENFNTNLYQGSNPFSSNPFNKQSIFS